jgi:hypothetical protein
MVIMKPLRWAFIKFVFVLDKNLNFQNFIRDFVWKNHSIANLAELKKKIKIHLTSILCQTWLIRKSNSVKFITLKTIVLRSFSRRNSTEFVRAMRTPQRIGRKSWPSPSKKFQKKIESNCSILSFLLHLI